MLSCSSLPVQSFQALLSVCFKVYGKLMSPTLDDLHYMLQLVPDNVDLVPVRLFDAVFAQ